ncbi:MAG: ATP-binding protein, partial [Myxococcota bacterium]
AEHREKVFKLFSRLHTESEYEGVGVGLALSDKLMKLHGGRIGIEDGIEGGTAFLCYFKAPPGDDDV